MKKMNDKFSELYHRAWTWAEFDDEYKENPTYERRCVVQSRIFAELIVRECAGACLHDDWEGPRWGRFYANKIREHFGVK